MHGNDAPFEREPLDEVIFMQRRNFINYPEKQAVIEFPASGELYGEEDTKLMLDRTFVIRRNAIAQAKQHKMDSLMESVCNVAVGFFISWAVWVFIVAPMFGFSNSVGTSFLVTCVFTVTSLIRQYVIRRLFNGKTIWEAIRAKIARPRVS